MSDLGGYNRPSRLIYRHRAEYRYLFGVLTRELFMARYECDSDSCKRSICVSAKYT